MSALEQAARWLEETTGAAAPPPEAPGRMPVSSGDRSAAEAVGHPDPAPPEDPEQLGPDADPESVARKILLDQLTGRARSRAELAEKLAKRKVPGEVAQRLLDRFEEVGLVDDAAFARLWVESRQGSKGLGRRALAQELRRKGVDAEVVKDALAEVDLEDEEDAARDLVRRRLRTLRRVDRATAARRLTGMLARKGHTGEVAWRVVREELEGFEGPDDDPDDGGGPAGDAWSP